MNEELIKRAEDLASRCARTGSVTATAFLTPAEQYELRDFRPRADCAVRFHGGVPGAERACAFFLPAFCAGFLGGFCSPLPRRLSSRVISSFP